MRSYNKFLQYIFFKFYNQNFSVIKNFSATIIGYSMNSGFPFSAYGESFFMAVQTMFIAYLICKYSGKTGTGILLNLLYSALLYVFISGFLTVEQLGYLQMTNVPLIVVSRLIQVMLF